MVQYCIILICGIWSLYNGLTVYTDLPYIDIFTEGGLISTALNIVALKWGILVGIVGILIGIAGCIILYKLEDLDKIKFIVMIFYCVFSILLIL